MVWRETIHAAPKLRNSSHREVFSACRSFAPHTIEMHEAPLKIAELHGYNICDALVVAAALEAGCMTLYSEDFRDGKT